MQERDPGQRTPRGTAMGPPGSGGRVAPSYLPPARSRDPSLGGLCPDAQHHTGSQSWEQPSAASGPCLTGTQCAGHSQQHNTSWQRLGEDQGAWARPKGLNPGWAPSGWEQTCPLTTDGAQEAPQGCADRTRGGGPWSPPKGQCARQGPGACRHVPTRPHEGTMSTAGHCPRSRASG